MESDVTMSRVNVAHIKARLSGYLRRVKAGETIVVCERGVPVAELRPIAESTAPRKRVFRNLHPDWEIPDSFFEPLPEELLAAFEGRDDRSDDPLRPFYRD